MRRTVWAIDAFDQPAVEAGKIRAKHYLSEMAVEEWLKFAA